MLDHRNGVHFNMALLLAYCDGDFLRYSVGRARGGWAETVSRFGVENVALLAYLDARFEVRHLEMIRPLLEHSPERNVPRVAVASHVEQCRAKRARSKICALSIRSSAPSAMRHRTIDDTRFVTWIGDHPEQFVGTIASYWRDDWTKKIVRLPRSLLIEMVRLRPMATESLSAIAR